jgi:hypothetical protein
VKVLGAIKSRLGFSEFPGGPEIKERMVFAVVLIARRD